MYILTRGHCESAICGVDHNKICYFRFTTNRPNNLKYILLNKDFYRSQISKSIVIKNVLI